MFSNVFNKPRSGGWLFAVAGLVAAAAAAQDASPGASMGGYNAMRVDHVGELTGSFDGTLEKMSGGVRIVLLSDDPEQKPLPLRASVMTFSYGDDKSTPSKIVMEGNVEIDHPAASVRAGRAEWDFKSGELVFTGDPVMSNERWKNVRGEKMVLNFETGRLNVSKLEADQIPLKVEETGDPNLFADADIKDWPALLDKMKSQAAADAPSPGKRIYTLFDPQLQGVFLNTPAENLVKNKGALLKQLNKVVKNPGLYQADAWDGVKLNEEIRNLLAKDNRTPDEQTRLNRLLIQAAYPAEIAAR